VLQENNSRPFELTWTSRDSPEPTALEDGGEATGDRIIVTASFPHIPEDPGSAIESVSWNVSEGIFIQTSGELLVLEPTYETGLLNLDEFVWNRVDGIRKGDNVSVIVDFSNSDSDVMAWWADMDNATWSYANNLVGEQMASSAKPESGSFAADHDGSIMVGIMNYDNTPGNYSLTVDTRRHDAGMTMGNKVSYISWYWRENVTVSMNFAGREVGGELQEVSYSNVTLNNFFAPQVTNINVVGDPVCLIEWAVYDLNQADEHFSEVFISNDGGSSFQLVAANLTETEYSWDSTGFVDQEYQAMVRVFDNDPELNPGSESRYWPGLIGMTLSSSFEAGTVHTGQLPMLVEIHGPRDFEFIHGTTGNKVSWSLHNVDSRTYVISVNGQTNRSGFWRKGDGRIVINLDFLEPGLYEVKLSLGGASDTVMVTVLESGTDDKLMRFVVDNSGLGLLLGSMGVIAVFSIGILKAKVRGEGYWSP
jgi:hypothetical protein